MTQPNNDVSLKLHSKVRLTYEDDLNNKKNCKKLCMWKGCKKLVEGWGLICGRQHFILIYPTTSGCSKRIMKNLSLENSGLLGHDVMSLGECFPSFQRHTVPSSSSFKYSNKITWPWMWGHYRHTLTFMQLQVMQFQIYEIWKTKSK